MPAVCYSARVRGPEGRARSPGGCLYSALIYSGGKRNVSWFSSFPRGWERVGGWVGLKEFSLNLIPGVFSGKSLIPTAGMGGIWATVVHGDFVWLLLNPGDISSGGRRAAAGERQPRQRCPGHRSEKPPGSLCWWMRKRQPPGRKETL